MGDKRGEKTGKVGRGNMRWGNQEGQGTVTQQQKQARQNKKKLRNEGKENDRKEAITGQQR